MLFVAPFLVINCTGEIPDERYGHSACVDSEYGKEGMMFVFGGCNSNQKHFSDELYGFCFRKWLLNYVSRQ